jgi:glycerol-3-phosphate dehydrogenase
MKTLHLDLNGPVHAIDFGGSGPTLVLVHGLGGSHLNWMRVAQPLTQHARVMALDLAGFGRTPLAGRSASVEANQELLHRFLQAVSPNEPALLMGNSMGGLISLRQAALHPQSVSGLVLVNPAQPLASGARVDPVVARLFALYAIPFLGEFVVKRRAAQVGPERLTRDQLKLCSADFASMPEELVQQHVALTRERHEQMPWSYDAFLEAARSLLKILRAKPAYRDMARRVTAPTLLVQGTEDRLVPVANSRELAALRPDWTYVEYSNIGHVPMMECPDAFLSSMARWLEGPGRSALGGAPKVAQAS